MIEKINSIFINSTMAGKNLEPEYGSEAIVFEHSGVDSMEFIKFLLEVEKELGIRIEEKYWSMKMLKSTAEIADYIAAKR